MSVLAYQIAPLLSQGPVPESARKVREAGFRVLVLCAREIQPMVPPEPGLTILRCPLVDDLTVALSAADWHLAGQTAAEVRRRIGGGEHALVTCMAGLNRSGLVSARVLCLQYGMSGREAIERVRLCRGQNALHNPRFVERLLTLKRQA